MLTSKQLAPNPDTAPTRKEDDHGTEHIAPVADSASILQPLL
jgi:hypothetical protein